MLQYKSVKLYKGNKKEIQPGEMSNHAQRKRKPQYVLQSNGKGY